MADLFLSYAREDRECAELLARALSSRGYSVWWDRRIPVGRSFSEVIEQELDQARCVIVLWSQHTIRSQWVQSEAEEAARRNVLVPVRIEDVRPPLEFRRLHAADLFDWRNGFAGVEFGECLASIEALVRKPASQERKEAPAPADNFRAGAYERKTAAPRSSARALGIVGAVLLVLILIVVSINPFSPKSHNTVTSDTTATSATDTTATSSTDSAATSTAGTVATDSSSVISTQPSAPPLISVSLENRCTTKELAVAVCYIGRNGIWNGQGWYVLAPKETMSGVADVVGPWIYFYGESGTSRWEAKEGERSFTVPVSTTKTFDAPIDQLSGEGFKSVKFFGREVAAGESTYTQVFTCPD
jgi:hypothetical protein